MSKIFFEAKIIQSKIFKLQVKYLYISVYNIYIYIIYANDVKSAHTHITILFGGVMYFGLRGEGRRNWEGRK